MLYFLEIAQTGLAAARLHRLRSAVTVAALIVLLLPYLVGIGLAKGIEAQAEESVRFGADLYVTGNQFGRPTPIPLESANRIRTLDGVTDVVPRIVGEVILGKDREHAVLVGLPPERLREWADCIDGEPPRNGGPNELVVGTMIARRLNLHVGSMLLPFYHNDRAERISRVVGVFKPDSPIWQANLILTTFETAANVFDQEGLATDLLVTCREGYEAPVSHEVEQGLAFTHPQGLGIVRTRVTAREDLRALLPRGLLHREGIFNLHFVLIFVVGILVVLVTSGLGLTERRREIGILKATGWQTDEILLRSLVESLCLAIVGGCVSLLLAWVWLHVFNGFAIAGVFLAGVDWTPQLTVPFRLTPVPAMLAFLLALAVVLSGTLYSSWRAAIVPSRETMR
jgi:ABC-type lipoprotein release transport system permease subunit